MNFEEAAKPLLEKFLTDANSNWIKYAKDKSSNLSEEILKLIEEFKDNLEGALRLHAEQWEHGQVLQIETADKLVEELNKLLPPPIPPEENLIVQARATWNKIELATSQAEILNILIEKISEKCDGVALFVLKGDKIIGWKSIGLSGEKFSDNQIGKVILNLQEGSSFFHSQKTYSFISFSPGHFPLDTALLEKLGDRNPKSIAVFPIVIKGKCVAFLYVDSSQEADIQILSFIELLVSLAAFAIETLPTRQSIISIKKAPVEKEIEKPKAEEIPKAVVEEKPVPPIISEEELKLHEEAKRFARLLVSEIKLYNEAQVALGRQNKDLYERLKDDIERSKRMYEERISPKIVSTTNYFYEELIRTLANGDPTALGVDKI